MGTIDLVREIRELKNHLSYTKNIGFFFGAGTSCALGIPNIDQLTMEVRERLNTKCHAQYDALKKDLEPNVAGRFVNIEDILNQNRRIREITNESPLKKYLDICGQDARELDKCICTAIYEIIMEKQDICSLDVPKRFLAWYNNLHQESTKEVFTSNYDLVVEKSLEENGIPYFDGFVGAYEPFFWQESIDKSICQDDLTINWIRLWKIHGSLSWFWKKAPTDSGFRILRIGKIKNIADEENELVIYPSKEKYESSRKQPFVAYFDRLKQYLLSGELLFIVSGYSFSDQHINEILFNCLRQNNRLFVLSFFFNDAEIERLHKNSPAFMNMNCFGPKTGIINGILGNWEVDSSALSSIGKVDSFYDTATSALTVGDFQKLVDFLIQTTGKNEKGI
ncbi:MAG: SIR2 family NAD-dependent protein deacylase [Desulfobacterales bacterium]